MVIATNYADLLNVLDQMAHTPHYHARRHTLVRAEETILSLERQVDALKPQLAQLQPEGGMLHGTYCGPLSMWHGKTALLRVVLLAQFDDRGQYTAYGWHGFDLMDFKIEEIKGG
jgi:hypothetical protein